MEENKQEKFKIRDLREKSKFVVDDKFLNGYAKFLGIYCVGVYSSLCRHVNKEQRCYPSQQKIKEELGISKKTVINSFQRLIFWNTIRVYRIGLKCTNRYDLLDKKFWKIITENNLKEYAELIAEEKIGNYEEICKTAKRKNKYHKFTKEKYLKKFFEVSQAHFKGLLQKLQESTTHTSIVKEHNNKETQKKGDDFFKKKKPYFWGKPMWEDKNGKWLVIHGQNDFREFTGKKSDIEWR